MICRVYRENYQCPTASKSMVCVKAKPSSLLKPFMLPFSTYICHPLYDQQTQKAQINVYPVKGLCHAPYRGEPNSILSNPIRRSDWYAIL